MTEYFYIGIDNGVTGSIAVIDHLGRMLLYVATPVEKCLNYTKKVAYQNRVDIDKMEDLLRPYSGSSTLILERPMVNPVRWKASVSALRCDMSTLNVLRKLKMKHIYVDSKEWQKEMLPTQKPIPRLKPGSAKEEEASTKKKLTAQKKETKVLSLAVGARLFPETTFKGDADAALMAEWARRTKL